MEPPDVPPPPYSVTDIHSGSDHQSPQTLTSSNSHADDASIAASSSRSNVIYTPPETPEDSHHAFTGAEDYQTTASAQVYFDTRPGPDRGTAPSSIVHLITISNDPSPSDFRYPNWASTRDTTQQDWRTFINYLIPDYADKANALIIDRKLRASEDGGTRSSASTRDATEAQLEQLRYSSQRRRFEDTVREWNAGFFTPRGVTIRIAQGDSVSEPKARMPGEWDSSFDTGAHGNRDAPLPAAADASSQQRTGWRNLLGNSFQMSTDERNGLRFGPITIDGDRIAIGSAFEADSSGVRWHGRDISGRSPGGGDDRGRNVRGHGRGSWWHDGREYDQRRGDFHHRRENFYQRRDDHRRRRDGDGRPQGRARSRSTHSHSSYSSSSSSDTASTVSSIGSLPDWDDLKDSQLPVVKNSVQAWLAHPDQPVTKADLKRAKAEIKAAKSLPQPATVQVSQRQEIKTLLSMFGDLKMTQRADLQAAKKERTAQKKAERRARRSQHRGERSEERRHRREHRRAEREMGRQQREVARQRRHGGPPRSFFASRHGTAQLPTPPIPPYMPGPANSVPPVPPCPPVPIVPGTSPVPLVSTMPQFGPGNFFNPGHPGGPFPFRNGANRGGHHQQIPGQHYPPTPGSSHSQQAQHREQAAQAQAAGHEQAAHQRAHAHEQAVEARAQAQAQAAQARAQAAQQTAQAKAHAAQVSAQAKQQADMAKAQAREQANIAKSISKEQKARYKEDAKRRKEEQKALAALHERLSAKYQAVENLEKQAEDKRIELQALQQKIENHGIAAAKAGRADQKRTATQTELDAEALEGEIEDLGSKIEGLMEEADEEYARGLEMSEAEKTDEGKVRWLD